MMKIGKLAAFAFLAAAASGCEHRDPEEGAARPSGPEAAPHEAWMDYIKLQAVQPTTGSSGITLTGKVSFDEEHTQRVASPLDGRVVSVDVKLGDRVKKGQSLVQLMSPQVAQIEADGQKAEQDFKVAEKSLQRAQRLHADGAIADKELAQANADFQKAKSDMERARAQLRALALSSVQPTLAVALRSQVAGILVERNVLVGQEVRGDAAQPLLTVSDLSTVWVLADVYEQDLGMVTKGEAVRVSVPAYPNETFSGKVIHVGEVVDAASRTVKVRCELANPDGRLKPEMFAKVELHEDTQHAVLQVPDKAVLMSGDKSEVVLAKNGKFTLQSVRVGPEVDGNIRVLEGLSAGDVVVTDGALFVRREIQD